MEIFTSPYRLPVTENSCKLIRKWKYSSVHTGYQWWKTAADQLENGNIHQSIQLTSDRKQLQINYESKFILDSFIFCVSPARILRWFAANVDFFPWSHVFSCDLFGMLYGEFNHCCWFFPTVPIGDCFWLFFNHGNVLLWHVGMGIKLLVTFWSRW